MIIFSYLVLWDLKVYYNLSFLTIAYSSVTIRCLVVLAESLYLYGTYRSNRKDTVSASFDLSILFTL